jgi:hypothetical protein
VDVLGEIFNECLEVAKATDTKATATSGSSAATYINSAKARAATQLSLQ